MSDSSKQTVLFGLSEKSEALNLREPIPTNTKNEITETKEKEETEEDVIPMIAGKKCGIPVTSQKTINDQVGGESSNELPLEPFAALEIGSVEKVTGEEPTAEDYEAIPVEEYGMAMLKKMGLKENEGIGLTNKAVVEQVQVKFRPKGVGLGAAAPIVDQ